MTGGDDLYRVLDTDGSVVDDVDFPELDDETLLEMYREMRLSRHFDERMVSLQRQGRIGTYSPLAGQEGAQIGSTHALRDDDWILYQYREHGTLATRGLDPEYIRYWMGHEEGNAWIADRHVFPLNICIGAHIPHATGMAWASKLKGDDTVFLCHFGDGATSEGDFHEGLNFAGVFDVPAVFFCNNNQWAISVPADDQTASETIAQKAAAYGMEGVRVDGMDPIAVYAVTRQAVQQARKGTGSPRPTLIEAVEYRYGAHTTADDPTAYRDDAEVEAWRERDPIARLGAYLRDRGVLNDDVDELIEEEITETVADLIDGAESMPDSDPETMFDYVFEEPTAEISAQRQRLTELREKYGDEALLEED